MEAIVANGTVFLQQPETYSQAFEEISKYNIHLNIFERLWAAWYAYMQNDVLATGIMSFVMHEAIYFGRSLPWIIIDAIPYFNKYKIQGVSKHATLYRYSILTFYHSKKFPQQQNNGPALNSSSSPTLPSSFLKSGSSIPWPNTSAWKLVFPSHPSILWPTRSPSSSC